METNFKLDHILHPTKKLEDSKQYKLSPITYNETGREGQRWQGNWLSHFKCLLMAFRHCDPKKTNQQF